LRGTGVVRLDVDCMVGDVWLDAQCLREVAPQRLGHQHGIREPAYGTGAGSAAEIEAEAVVLCSELVQEPDVRRPPARRCDRAERRGDRVRDHDVGTARFEGTEQREQGPHSAPARARSTAAVRG